MTRVLVVHHDIDIEDIEVDALRRAGYEVDQCAGPIGALNPCPVLNGQPCWQVERADVVVYDMLATGDGRSELIEDLRDVHPDKPVVLTSPGLMLNWVESEGPHGVTPAPGGSFSANGLAAAVETALASRDSSESEGSGGPNRHPAARRPYPMPGW
jgi:DNA-binding NtrC family response regulator